MSPAILTETVWQLAKETPGAIPDEVVAITTLDGQQSITKHLQTPSPKFGGRTVWQSLREDLIGPKAAQDERLTLRVSVIDRPDPGTGGTEKLPDIRNRGHNLAAAEFILREVRHHTDTKDRRLIASLAGGRKTMGALLHAAFTHLARPQDRLTHILVSEPYDALYDAERNPLFFYPTQPEQILTRPDGKSYQARDAELELADVPFAPLRVRFPDIAEIPDRFRNLVEMYSETFRRDATSPVVIELIDEPPRVVVNGFSVELESERQMTVIRFLLEANQKNWLQKNQDEALEVFKAWHGYEPQLGEIRPVLRETIRRLHEKRKAKPGDIWIAKAVKEDIKRPLSFLRTALDEGGSAWKPPLRDLRLPPFRLAGDA
jgi:CRISPR-associated protein (TIGR02584 family)